MNYDTAKRKRSRGDKRYYEVSRPEASFARRRCPGCGSGQYKRVLWDNNPNLRACSLCNLNFDLIKDGVVPNLKPKKAPAEKSGVVGLPIRERSERPLRRNFFELRDLAMLTRRA